ncbi:MAG: asparagine synthase C-terminal domain-containing protein [Deltaproteobacteria bacterium]|nr:asparagine synthase C-terminal domain-containing protein [Deltaproteobacteria bacterium]
MHFYLTYRYIPHPYTVFQSIRKLPPAHLLLLEGGKMRIDPWQLTRSPLTQRNEEALCEEVVERLRQAVRSRMISDVSLGVFLSVEIDSSAVVALMTEASITPVRTFSIGFEGDGDDLDRARMVAQAFGTEHHELVVKPDSASLLPWLVRHLDEPFADPSIIPTFYLAQFAREHVTVALNGDGGDETFAGYSKYWQDRAAAWLGALPNAIYDMLFQGAIALLKGLAHRRPSVFSDILSAPALKVSLECA